MEADVFKCVRHGYTVVCASSRLARRLKYRYARLQISQGKKAWPTPDILPWMAWLLRCWHESVCGESRDLILLSTEQQLYVWQQLIRETGSTAQLLQIPATARQALDAWNTLRDWRIPAFPEGYFLHEDARVFQTWCRAYGDYCRDGGLIDATEIPAYLLEHSSHVPRLSPVALAGFEDITPLQQHLITGLRQRGMEIQIISHPRKNGSVIAAGCGDTLAEIRSAALWSRRWLESADGNNIGIAVRDLRSLHTSIENIFDDILLPGSILTGAVPESRPYSIVQGLPFGRYPLIKAALDVIGLGDVPVPLEILGSVLRSPFLRGAETESQGRALLDACLRKYGEHRMRLNSLDYYAGRYLKGEIVPGLFLDLCRAYLEVMAGASGKRTMTEWAGIFTSLLNSFGWPGDRTLTSIEYQIVMEWRDLMERFASLDPACHPLNYREALGYLRQLAGTAGFQAETPETPIQIMGMAGAAAMQFEHLWVLGLDEESWPDQADPNPFIPMPLQRDAGVPRATAEGALAQAVRDMERLLHASAEIVLSYPEHDKDRPLRPSPLIKEYIRPQDGYPWRQSDFATILFESRRFEESADDMAPVIPAGEAVAGGTTLFGDQAACPFRACARHRLYAVGVEHRDIGLDAMERGSVMHEVMQRLWEKIPDHASLQALPGAQLDNIISRCISSVLSVYRKKFPVTLSDGFIRLEAARIGTIIHDWLELERQRRPFRVSKREYRHQVSIGAISVSTRIDRIDCLDDGRYVIIDYKTGDAKISAWLGERPDEPQLPLYAITSEGEIAAVAFAGLRSGRTAFTGLAQEEGLIPGLTTVERTRISDVAVTDWHSLFEGWRAVLTRLALDFRSGVARVDPKRHDTCTWCDLHSLCRIYDRGTGNGERDSVDG